jgi:hypothetical protein
MYISIGMSPAVLSIKGNKELANNLQNPQNSADTCFAQRHFAENYSPMQALWEVNL